MNVLHAFLLFFPAHRNAFFWFIMKINDAILLHKSESVPLVKVDNTEGWKTANKLLYFLTAVWWCGASCQLKSLACYCSIVWTFICQSIRNRAASKTIPGLCTLENWLLSRCVQCEFVSIKYEGHTIFNEHLWCVWNARVAKWLDLATH